MCGNEGEECTVMEEKNVRLWRRGMYGDEKEKCTVMKERNVR
jgi:hypothetical protein